MGWMRVSCIAPECHSETHNRSSASRNSSRSSVAVRSDPVASVMCCPHASLVAYQVACLDEELSADGHGGGAAGREVARRPREDLQVFVAISVPQVQCRPRVHEVRDEEIDAQFPLPGVLGGERGIGVDRDPVYDRPERKQGRKLVIELLPELRLADDAGACRGPKPDIVVGLVEAKLRRGMEGDFHYRLACAREGRSEERR